MAKVGGATKKRMFLLLFRFDPNGEQPPTRYGAGYVEVYDVRRLLEASCGVSRN
ncbi:hypothetical protein E1A91_A03G090000v1 [Gossypium mustelinum]|uniref:Uncharacterized protein n=1 Tax=Gossypium mustelinum TaxID=34275 RepID=A0A5D2ZW37_GOSMU|nr:hypothetical protein E1A91_A03G090000v1 [Gossypium mustelinum]